MGRPLASGPDVAVKGPMGFFSNLFGGGGEKPPTTSSELLAEPRGQHYVMAHVALRQSSLHTPLMALDLLSDPKRGLGFLGRLFDDVTKNVAKNGQPTTIKSPTFKLHPIQNGAYFFAVVEMPVARAMAEAHYVAIAVDKADVDSKAKDARGRYFTLELGSDFSSGALRSVLCEWQGDRHMNYGDGPFPPNPAAFVAAIVKVLDGSAGARASSG